MAAAAVGGDQKSSGAVDGDATSDTSDSAGQSEAAATQSNDAAGTASKLPATGSDSLALVVAGALLLAAGFLARSSARA